MLLTCLLTSSEWRGLVASSLVMPSAACSTILLESGLIPWKVTLKEMLTLPRFAHHFAMHTSSRNPPAMRI